MKLPIWKYWPLLENICNAPFGSPLIPVRGLNFAHVPPARDSDCEVVSAGSYKGCALFLLPRETQVRYAAARDPSWAQPACGDAVFTRASLYVRPGKLRPAGEDCAAFPVSLQAVSESERSPPLPPQPPRLWSSLSAWPRRAVGGGCLGLRISSGTSSLASVGGSAHWLVFRAWVAEFADSCQSPG